VFSHVPQQIASSSLNFVAVQITKYHMVFYTVHNSQFTVHSSQFIAHSSQLTAHTPAVPIFRDRLTPATELSKHPSEKAYRGSYPYVTRRIFFLWCPWTNLSKPPSTKRPRVTSRQDMKRTRHIPMPCFQRLNFQIKFRISVHAQVVLAGYPLLQWPLFVLATLCSSQLL
jgi:hypothetical protein